MQNNVRVNRTFFQVDSHFVIVISLRKSNHLLFEIHFNQNGVAFSESPRHVLQLLMCPILLICVT